MMRRTDMPGIFGFAEALGYLELQVRQGGDGNAPAFSAACLASVSALSLPGIPACPLTQAMATSRPRLLRDETMPNMASA
jgi:hypothetical protein